MPTDDRQTETEIHNLFGNGNRGTVVERAGMFHYYETRDATYITLQHCVQHMAIANFAIAAAARH